MKRLSCHLFLLSLLALLLSGLFACTPAADATTPTSDAKTSAGSTETPADDPTKEQVVPVEGLTADDPTAAQANTMVLNAAIAEAEQGTVLQVAGGTYCFSDVSAYGARIALTLYGKKNLTIRGAAGDTLFLNVSYSPKEKCNPDAYMRSNFFVISGCEQIAIEGITFDYLAPTNLSAEVISVSESENYTLLRPLDANDGISGGEYVFCVNLFSADGMPISEYWMDAADPACLTAMGDGTFRLSGNFGSQGQLVCARFTSGTYASPLLYVENTDGLTLRDCRVLSCPSATVYAPGGNANFCFERFSIGCREGEHTLFCSNEDGIHIKGLRGTLTIRDCHFEGMGDDALNLHSKAAVVLSVAGQSVTAAEGRTKGTPEANWARVGDRVDFFTPQLVRLGSAVITAIDGAHLTFDVLPAGVGVNTVLQNVSNAPTSVVICGTTVKRSRARGFLLQCPVATVTDCHLENTALSGLLIAPDVGQWYEMGPAQNITVENCTFSHCGTAANAAIAIRANHDGTALSAVASPLHGSVTVSGCSFSDCAVAVYARRVQALTVTDDCTFADCAKTVDE